MNRIEYERTAAAEEDHWWHRGLRDLVARTVRARPGGWPPRPRVLDAGCGTGANLRLLGGLLRPGYLGGFDLEPLAVELAARKAPDADVYVSDLRDPELRSDGFDLILSCDVVYATGLEAARPGLRRLVAGLAPGGLFVLNLPAYRWLYSDHDRAVGTRERFTAGRVGRLLSELGLEVDALTYRLCGLFPLVALARLPSILRPAADASAARSDLDVPPRPVNVALARAVRLENAAIARGVRLPWGSSVWAVGRKPASSRRVAADPAGSG